MKTSNNSLKYVFKRKKINSSKFVEEIKVKKAQIISPNKEIHLDGEPLLIENTINIEVLPLSLNVISNE